MLPVPAEPAGLQLSFNVAAAIRFRFPLGVRFRFPLGVRFLFPPASRVCIAVAGSRSSCPPPREPHKFLK
ncbi:hypothetical protein [Methanimicrococcus hongohii]|uniref:hypothetical protein n=1 Tax=Methanimicrococcus hongohii TaxID=3028295 RepID=UPI002931560E|nr:hypothetical protein [Methanimicrococcus sp. Hf6]